jgi:hypothetical protein
MCVGRKKIIHNKNHLLAVSRPIAHVSVFHIWQSFQVEFFVVEKFSEKIFSIIFFHKEIQIEL